MKADLTRNTFDAARHYSRVLMQQGRVQLDADWNEQAAILLHHLRTLIIDLLGNEDGGPDGNLGFNITPVDGAQPKDLRIGPGHYYVGGLLCESDGKASYLSQPYYKPVPDAERLDKLAVGDYTAFLDVWERQITYIEDPRIREVALGGPDTAARTQIVWQVKLRKTADPQRTPSAAKLRARARQNQQSTEPCLISPDVRFRGLENQLYRVEVHTPGPAGTASFKFSRENGSVTFAIVSPVQGRLVTVASLGRDDRLGLEVGDWVEVVDDDYVLQNRAEPLLRVEAIDSVAMQVTLSAAPTTNVGQDLLKHPLLRRWDQRQGDPALGGLVLKTDGTVSITENSGDLGWITLEDGVQIQFQPKAAPAAPAILYITGDYWLIPARTATGDVEWPTETDANGDIVPAALETHGIKHALADIGTVSVAAGGVVSNPHDHRRTFKLPATRA